MIRRIFVLCIVVLVLVSLFSMACAPAAPPNIAGPFAKGIATMATTTLNLLKSEIQRIDGELTALNTKLGKVEQVVAPALVWIELTKAKAQREEWGGQRILQVSDDLTRMRNDQYQVVKLQLGTELVSGGWKFASVIQVDDVATGAVASYEELRDDLKRKIAALMQQRQMKVQTWNVVQSTANDALQQGANWKIAKVDSVTYQVSGQGLGWDNGLTRGEWLYYTNTGNVTASGASAQALEKVLKGR